MVRRMLVVDDEDVILAAVCDYFTLHGFVVDCAHDRDEAEALLDELRYAVVVADLRLCEPNGREGLDVIAFARKRSPDATIVLVTAYASPETEREAYVYGADLFLAKPQPLPLVRQILEEYVEGHS